MVNMRAEPLSRNAGFSLVEVLVGMVIGLLGTIVIFQVFAVAEGQKRTTTSGGDAHQNAVFALYSLERDLRQSGMGFNNNGLLGCRIRQFFKNTSNPSSSVKRIVAMVPFALTAGVGAGSDKISVMYMESDSLIPPVGIDNPPPGVKGVEHFKINPADEIQNFQPGDVVVISELDDTGYPKKLATNQYFDCSMVQVTAVDVPNRLIKHEDIVQYTDIFGYRHDVRFNSPDGFPNGLPILAPMADPIQYSQTPPGSKRGGHIYRMGQSVAAFDYFIQDSQLKQTNSQTGTTSIVADGIVMLKAQYGFDANNNGKIDDSEWTKTGPTTPDGWRQLRAIRLALVARSAQMEKPNLTSGVCDATSQNPTWFGTDQTVNPDVPLDITTLDPVNWKCYRYITLQTVVPLRNMLWTPEL